MVGEAGLEPATTGLEGRCSIQLSYSPAGYHFIVIHSPGYRETQTGPVQWGRKGWCAPNMGGIIRKMAYLFSSWYSCSVLMFHKLALSMFPARMLSTAVMAVSMEWS